MNLEWRARSSSLAWSNPVARWWGLLTLVSGVNIAVWFALYGTLQEPRTSGFGSASIELMLLLFHSDAPTAVDGVDQLEKYFRRPEISGCRLVG